MGRGHQVTAEEKKEREATVAELIGDMASDISDRAGISRARSLSTVVARENIFGKEMEKVLTRHLSRRYSIGRDYRPRSRRQTERVLNVMLSDLHYGAMLDPREVGHRYGHVEEARRTAAVVLQVAEHKHQYRAETELIVHVLGDIIQNQLHDPRDGAPLAEQVAAAMHLLTQALTFWAGHFKKVTVYCTPGNHGRNQMRHQQRAVCQKWDSIEAMIYTAMKIGVKHLPHVQVVIPRTPFYVYETFGMRGFMSHGDTVVNPGYPGRAIQVESIEKQVNRINGKLGKGERYSLFGVGHVHTYSVVKLPNRIVFMSNGCLIPADGFAQSIGLTETACCQSIWETVPGHMVGHRHEADVDERTDRDRSLDKIIQPWRDF